MKIKNVIYLHRFFTDPWCNGSTTDFGSVCPGSNPGGSTRKQPKIRLLFFNFTK